MDFTFAQLKINLIICYKVTKFFGNLTHFDDICLLYTSDAADDLLCVDLGGRRIIKKKKQN